MKVVQMFQSIQGEGAFIGVSAIFIRLAGCNLQCPWCDTKESWDGSRYDDLAPVQLALRVEQLAKAPAIVIITGGEPTIQKDLGDLIKVLHQKGYKVHLETNGTFEYLPTLNCDWVACSPKPSTCYMYFPVGVDELKYVVTEEFNADVAISESTRTRFAGRIWLQPCDYHNDRKNLEMRQKAVKIAQGDMRLRVGCQLHKVLGVD